MDDSASEECEVVVIGGGLAGLTAASVKPWAKHRGQGMLKIQRQARAAQAASAFCGHNVRSTTVRPLPLKSSSIPPLIKIIERHTDLIHPA